MALLLLNTVAARSGAAAALRQWVGSSNALWARGCCSTQTHNTTAAAGYSTSTSTSVSVPPGRLPPQQQQPTPTGDAPADASWRQQPTTQPASWLQQLASFSRQERLSVISRMSITLQGMVAELQAAGPMQVLAAASPLLPKAAFAAAVTAATAAAAPAAGVMANFHGSRYTGSNSLSSWRPGEHWLRQAGMQDSRVTALLVAANVGCYGMQQISTTFTGYCVRLGYKVAAGEYWRLLTAAFVHHNLLHFGINTLAVWNMGRMIEPQLGGTPFLAVYLGSAVCGNLLGFWMSPGYVVSMGSSSALYGLLGAFLSHSFINRHSAYTSRSQVASVLQTLGINLALMTFFGGGMDLWAHAGGFVGGAVVAAAVAPRHRY